MDNNYVVHVQNEDGSFYTIEVVAECYGDILKEFPNAYLIESV